jgi:DNA-binding transcriptional MerR regulator
MLLKVGELAKRTGLTVRTLHYYDASGVLTPSERSDAGYRLYSRDDVARLHAIQALRQIGLPLHEIGTLLAGNPEPLPTVIARQIVALDRQIEQASELRGRLRLLQSQLVQGTEPDMAEWLAMLGSMATYGKYFTASELKKIFENWRLTEGKWKPLIADIRAAMNQKTAPENLALQPLARRWMDLSVQWMKGDFELMQRWQKMYMQEPAAQGKNGADLDLVQYINKAVAIRVQAFLRHFSQEELQRLDVETENDWMMLAGEVDDLVRRRVAATGKKAQAMVEKWDALVDQTVRHDPLLRQKFLCAHDSDPVIEAGAIIRGDIQQFIRKAWRARCSTIEQR